MLENQLWIKIILIAVFAVFTTVMVAPARGDRRLAVRRLALISAFLGCVTAIAFPQVINFIANLLGVGRGTDLILYGLVVVFVGNAITSAAHNRALQRELTLLARAIALSQIEPPAQGIASPLLSPKSGE